MKKIIVVLLILGILAVIGLGIFISTFDINGYRSVIEAKLETAVGNPVKIDKVTLKWNGALALAVQGIHVYSGGDQNSQPVLDVENASASLSLLPVLRRSFELGNIEIVRPRLHILKSQNGEISVSGVRPRKNAAMVNSSTPFAAAGLSFMIQSLGIREAVVRYTDQSIDPPLDITVSQADIRLKNISLLRPMDIETSFAVLSGTRNITMRGRLIPPRFKKPAVLENFKLETDLNRWDIPQLLKAFPAAKNTGIESIAGKLQAEIQSLNLDEQSLASLSAKVTLKGGYLKLDTLGTPFEKIELEAAAAQDRLTVDRFSMEASGGRISGSGTGQNLSLEPSWTFQAVIDELPLEEWVMVRPGDPELQGRLSMKFQGQSTGMNEERFLRSMSGDGELHLKKGVLKDLNVLREIFQSLNMLPGLVPTLLERLPESYKAKLNARDTLLEPIDLPFAIQKGVLLLDKLRVAGDGFELNGNGTLGVEGLRTLNLKARINVDKELSLAMSKSVNELQYLTIQDGRLEIPVRIIGTQPWIIPDLGYVASKLVVLKAQDVIGDLLRGNKKQEPVSQGPIASQPATTAQTSSPSAPAKPSMSDLLSGLLDEALKKK